ncbi:MAG: transcriptional repressor LexA [bacterium]
MTSLTRRQHDILKYISDSIRTRDRFPSYREIGKRFGFRSPATVSQHIHALVRKGFLRKVGRHLMLSPENRIPHGVPIVGKVAAGTPIMAVENYEGYLDIDSMTQDADHFAVRVIGNSMRDIGILDGDYVIVRHQDTFEDGDIVVAYIGDDPEATVKVIHKRGRAIELEPRCADYEVISLYPGKHRLRIGGKVIGLVRYLRG